MKKIISIALFLLGTNVAFASPQISFERYVELSKRDAVRCVEHASTTRCDIQIEYAFEAGIIDHATMDWSKAYGYFPIIHRGDRLLGVCPCR